MIILSNKKELILDNVVLYNFSIFFSKQWKFKILNYIALSIINKVQKKISFL